MRFAVETLAIILSLLAGMNAFAECTDKYIADCGHFKILTTVCPSFDPRGRPTGGTETFMANFDDMNIGKISLAISIYNDLALYQVEVSPGVTTVVTFSSPLLTSLTARPTYNTYTIENGAKGIEHACKEYK